MASYNVVVRIDARNMEDTFDGDEYQGNYYSQTYLSGDDYCWERLTKNLIEATKNARWYSNLMIGITILLNVIGAAGTLLAVFNRQNWVPVTAAAVFVVNTFVGEMRLDEKAEKYRTINRKLSEVKVRWLAMPREARKKPDLISKMVMESEAVIAMLLPASTTTSKPEVSE